MGRKSEKKFPNAGVKLRELRTLKGISSAEKLLEWEKWGNLDLPLDPTTIRRWERQGIPESKLLKVCEFFNINISDLIQDENILNKFPPHISLRQVNKIICLIKSHSIKKTPLLLTYFSPDWRMDLFINFTLPDQKNNDNNIIKQLLSKRLNIKPADILCEFDRNNSRMKSRTRKETADAQKIAVYGQNAQYNFFYATVMIKNPPSYILKKSFICNDYQYNWRSMFSLKNDENIRTYNYDIINFITEKFDSSLHYLKNSFENNIT